MTRLGAFLMLALIVAAPAWVIGHYVAQAVSAVLR